MDTRLKLGLLLFILITGVCLFFKFDTRRYDVRDRPLAHPIAISSVSDGVLHLADGRALHPAGITFPTEPAAREAAMSVLRLSTRQGVEVRSDLGDGSAFLTCEPRFYNWCGTGQIKGWYIPCGLSELLVTTGYAMVNPKAGIAPNDLARLHAAEQLRRERADSGQPVPFIESGIRFDGFAHWLGRIDEYIEARSERDRP